MKTPTSKPQMDSFGRMQCPGCGEYIPVVTRVNKMSVDLDFRPMAEHWVDDHGPDDPRMLAVTS